jgi:two-component system alkaline phosphatase synthesis response regulator PhoP
MDTIFYFEGFINKSNKETFSKDEIFTLLKDADEKRLKKIISEMDITIDDDKLLVRKGDKEIVLPKLEYKVLRFLMLHKNKFINRDELLYTCWGNDIIVSDRSVDVCICKIKKALGNKEIIQTRKGYGYMFESI